MGIKGQLALGASALLYLHGAHAFELTLIAGAELEWTDNVFLSDEIRRNDLLEVINLGARAEEAESWYTLNIDYQASHERYERESFDAETYYSGAASLNLIPLPGRFEWLFRAQSETTLSQSVLPDTPDNRDQRNTYSTAPRLTLLSLPRDTVYLSAEASTVTFRNASDSESDRVGGSLSWLHAFSQLTSLDVTAGYEKVNFEVSEDYEREYYRIGINRALKSGSFAVSAGQTRLIPEFSDELEGTNFLASLDWEIDAHAIRLEIAHDLTDTSVGFADGVSAGPVAFPIDDVNTGQADIVTRTRVSLSDTYSPDTTTSISLQIFGDEENSEVDTTETKRQGGVVTLRRELKPGLEAELTAGYEKSREIPTDIEDDTSNVRLSLAKRFGQQLTLSSWVEREESDSDLDLLDYEAHRVGVSLTAEF
jgi:hypothetical protein